MFGPGFRYFRKYKNGYPCTLNCLKYRKLKCPFGMVRYRAVHPFRFPKAHGGVYRSPQGPGVFNLFSGGPARVGPKGIKAVASLPSQAQWSSPLVFRRRFRFVRGFLQRDVKAEGIRLHSAHWIGPQDTPYQGTLRTHTHRRALGHDHRHASWIAHCPYDETKTEQSSSKDPPSPSGSSQTLGQRKDPRLPSRKNTIFALGHSRGQVFLARATRRRQIC